MVQYITGFHAIEELLKAAVPEKHRTRVSDSTMRILYSKRGPRVKKIIRLAEQSGVSVEQGSRFELDQLAQALPLYARDHRGVILVVDRPQPESMSFEELLAGTREKSEAVVVLLDSITDPHNIGAIIRSVDQFGADAVIVPKRRTAGDMETITRVSAGAAAWRPLVTVPNLVRAAAQLKAAGFWMYGADMDGAAISEMSFTGKTALIMGSEGSGISPLLRKSCDSMFGIPTWGRVDSLNVSVACGICLYEIKRQSITAAHLR